MQREAFALINNPRLNKGTAFTLEERERYGLHGLLPPNISTIDQQVEWAIDSIRRKPQDIDKYRFMISMMKRNERLYYRILIDHIEELMPVVYTPTVGQACQEYAYQFRETTGFYISFEHRGRISELMSNWIDKDVRLIVVTDGERILGLGDLGVSGMGIPIGKLSLYTACAGIDPVHCMPITLDVGTDNESFLNDPLYQGRRQKRVRGSEYDGFIEEFISAIKSHFPNALLQFEDFATNNAVRLLQRYQDQLLCFNDDIQGTASVALAGLIAATRVTGQKLSEMRVLFAGAGSAATGIASLLAIAMQLEGLGREEALSRICCTDSKGLITKDRENLTSHAAPFAAHMPAMSLEEAISIFKPDALIGATGRGSTFSQNILKAMGEINEKPIIFALSNPTTKAECTAEDAYQATDGRAIFASGSPFNVVNINGQVKVPGQGNNAYIFPGLGLGVLQAGVTRVTDDLLITAASALADEVSVTQLELGCLYPPLNSIRQVSQQIAIAVGKRAQELGLTQELLPPDFEERVKASMYDPRY
jgi:malate dehydrogenase (oxaloacetate-decarboxylating)(NADP+)